MTRARRTNNRNQQSARQMVRAAARQDHGHKIVPSVRPPQFVRLPWNSYIFSATYATSPDSNKIQIDIGTIRAQIISRMGLTAAPGVISMKVQTAQAWNTSIGPSFAQPSLESLFYELSTDSGGSYSVRSEQYDHGTLNIPARGGYLYPLTDRKEVHTKLNDSHVVATFVTPAQANGNVTVRVKLLWNCAASNEGFTGEELEHQNPTQLD